MRVSATSVRSLATVLTVLAATDTAVRAGEAVIDLGRGPVVVHIPSSYDRSVPAPLLLLLHGYSSNGAVQEAYMQFAPVAEERGILYLHPDGTVDFAGNRLVERCRGRLDALHDEDREEAVELNAAIETAVSERDPMALAKAEAELAELLFFVEGR